MKRPVNNSAYYVHISYCIAALVCYIFFTVPDTALEVRALSDVSTPVLGLSYTMNCVGHKTTSGLSSLPTPQWLTLSGDSLGSGVQLQGPVTVGLSSSRLAAYFSILRTSHAGNYSCRASLSSPALTTPLVKTTSFGITVQRMSALSIIKKHNFYIQTMKNKFKEASRTLL